MVYLCVPYGSHNSDCFPKQQPADFQTCAVTPAACFSWHLIKFLEITHVNFTGLPVWVQNSEHVNFTGLPVKRFWLGFLVETLCVSCEVRTGFIYYLEEIPSLKG
jgi:hypothetical protein